MKYNILCVDEYEVAGLEFARILNNESINIVSALNDIEACRLLSEEACRFSAVIWVVNAGGILGFDNLKDFMERNCSNEVPIILITGLTGRKFVDRAIELGIREYIVKPFDSEDTKKKIYKILGLEYREAIKGMIDDILTFSFPELYDREIGAASRGRYSLSIMLVTVLNLHGSDHDAGQFNSITGLLKKVISSRLRQTDLVFHFRDNNLMLLLPFADKKGSQDVEAKIRDVFSSHSMLQSQNKDLNIAISSVTYPDDGKVRETLLEILQAVHNSKTGN